MAAVLVAEMTKVEKAACNRYFLYFQFVQARILWRIVNVVQPEDPQPLGRCHACHAIKGVVQGAKADDEMGANVRKANTARLSERANAGAFFASVVGLVGSTR